MSRSISPDSGLTEGVIPRSWKRFRRIITMLAPMRLGETTSQPLSSKGSRIPVVFEAFPVRAFGGSRPASISLALAVGCALAACGGTQGASRNEGETSSAATDPCEESEKYTYKWLVTFEADAFNADQLYVSWDTTGPLVVSDTSQPVETRDPKTGDAVTGYKPMAPTTMPIPHCGDDLGIHLVATDLTKWGLNFSVDTRALGDPAAFDGAGWTGISFWARVGSGSSGTVALAGVMDAYTAPPPNNDPPKAWLVTHCELVKDPKDSEKCDPYSRGVGLEEDWRFYAIPFGAMRQKGYGVVAPSLDVEHLFGFKFNLGLGDWDVWLDDIGYYKPKDAQ